MVLGVASTILCALGGTVAAQCGWLEDHERAGVVRIGDRVFTILLFESWAARDAMVLVEPPIRGAVWEENQTVDATYSYRFARHIEGRSTATALTNKQSLSLARSLTDDRDGKQDMNYTYVKQSGWPMKCLQTNATLVTNNAPLCFDGYRWKLVKGNVSHAWQGVYLPTTAIWSGLIVNTVFWSAAWWCLLFFPVRLRRIWRRRRGLCPACAYDLVHDFSRPCPECGGVPKLREATLPRL